MSFGTIDDAIAATQLGGRYYGGRWQDVGTPERLRQLDVELGGGS